jgi:MarR family 2-MHQ and catechol resistance regulon transcriptional repressor
MKTKVNSYGERADRSMRTWIQLSRAFHKISTKEIAYFKTHNLTLHQFKVLEVLYHRGDLSVGAITKLTMSTPGNITVVVRNLKRDGWIEAISDPSDRRSTNLSILPKGKEVIESMFPQHAKNLEENFGMLSDEELDILFALLRKVQKVQ